MATMQQVLVIYDIPDDRIRQKMADACLDYGLDRVQFSAFQGLMRRSHQRELMHKARTLLGRAPGKVLLIPVGNAEWEQRLEVSRE
ncbi:MAG: CRISPR-associated endonuclease Cas2 [Anaerolineae bacterium]